MCDDTHPSSSPVTLMSMWITHNALPSYFPELHIFNKSSTPPQLPILYHHQQQLNLENSNIRSLTITFNQDFSFNDSQVIVSSTSAGPLLHRSSTFSLFLSHGLPPSFTSFPMQLPFHRPAFNHYLAKSLHSPY